jgi:hypothetical protein
LDNNRRRTSKFPSVILFLIFPNFHTNEIPIEGRKKTATTIIICTIKKLHYCSAKWMIWDLIVRDALSDIHSDVNKQTHSSHSKNKTIIKSIQTTRRSCPFGSQSLEEEKSIVLYFSTRTTTSTHNIYWYRTYDTNIILRTIPR